MNYRLRNNEEYSSLTPVSTAPRKQVQCAFHLMNILFSDSFIEDFASIGDVSNREKLDTGKREREEYFWEGVQKAFTDGIYKGHDFLLLLMMICSTIKITSILQWW